MVKKVDTAQETETDNEVGDGETLVDQEAKANKDYTKGMTAHEVASMQANLIFNQNTIAAEPDSDFGGEGVGSSVGAIPGIYSNVVSYHVEALAAAVPPKNAFHPQPLRTLK